MKQFISIIFLISTTLIKAQVIIPITDNNGHYKVTNQNELLDSIINHSKIYHPQLICISNNCINIDSLLIKKTKVIKKDTSLYIQFGDNTHKIIKAKELWGVVTDYNERQRFYNTNTYIIWQTKAPYIYKYIKNNNAIFYFSETLTSDIFLLSDENIDLHCSDSKSKEELHKYILEHKSLKYNKNELAIAFDTDGIGKTILETSVDALIFIGRVAVVCSKIFCNR